MRLMRKCILQAGACAHQRAKSLKRLFEFSRVMSHAISKIERLMGSLLTNERSIF